MQPVKQARVSVKIFALLFSLFYLALAKSICPLFTASANNFSGLLQADFPLGFTLIVLSIALLQLCASLFLFNCRSMYLSSLLFFIFSLMPQDQGALFKDLHLYGTLCAWLLYLWPFFQDLYQTLTRKPCFSLWKKVKNLPYRGQVDFGVAVIVLMTVFLWALYGFVQGRIQFFFICALALWLSLMSFESYGLCM